MITKNELIEIYKLIKPKFYNKITWIIVTAGLFTIAPPVWSIFVNIFFGKNVSYYFFSEYDVITGLALIIIGLGYNVISQKINLPSNQKKNLISNSEIVDSTIFQVQGDYIINNNFATTPSELEEFKDLLKGNGSLYREWIEQIQIYQTLLNEFKPKTALKLVEALEIRLKESEISNNKTLLSKIEFLKALCFEQDKNTLQTSYITFIKAFELNMDNIIYKEKACFCYHKIGEFDKAKQLVQDLKTLNRFNATANAINILLNLDYFEHNINDLPSPVKNDFNFRRIIYVSLNENVKVQFCSVFPELILKDVDIQLFDLSYLNFKQNLYLVELSLNRFLREFRIEFVKSDYSDDKTVLKTFKILDSFISSIEGTEISGLKNVLFYKIYLEYLVTNDTNHLIKLGEVYKLLDTPVEEFFSLILANTLQQEDKDIEAINLINNLKSISQNMISLKFFCVQKIKESKLIIETVKQQLDILNEIGITETFDILRCVRITNSYDKIAEFPIEKIAQKTFELDELKRFVTVYLKVISHDSSEENKIELNELKELILQYNNSFNTYIQEAYFNNKNYLESIERFESINEADRTPYDIHLYIHSLIILKVHNKDLLKWLKYWRTEFKSYDSRFVRIEIDKRALISDWKECLLVCEFAIENEQHEDYLYYLAISTYHLNDKTSFIKHLDALINYNYQKSQVAIQIINILFHFEYFDEGLELCYYWAKNKDDKNARTLFFSSFIKVSEKFFIDFDVVNQGNYIRYTLNAEDQIHTRLIDTDDFSKSIYGKKVGDKVEVKRMYGDQMDSLLINRVCNKYLALKLEIMDETNNPHSGLGLQSFNLNDFDSPMDAIMSIIPKQDDEADPYELYYNNEINYSHLPYYVGELNKNLLATYYKLVYDKKGLLKIEPKLFPYFSIYDDYTFILDFSSLPHLYELSKQNLFFPTCKFKVSSFMMVLLKSYKEDFLSYRTYESYTLNGVFYDDLIKWVENNCEIVIPESLLDMIEDKEINREQCFMYLINEAAMIQEFPNSILITDDLTFYKIYPLNQMKLMSTDIFLLYEKLKITFESNTL